ncbi:MAG: SCP2 sterol-binding domain-containing protein [Candidatus Aminicenantes bacterium]|nr:SCP2 sterol-binding domain-containing protein [Candidatus Aminicenantes bacterium]
MPYFKNENELQDIQRAFFERLASNPEVGPKLKDSGLIIRLQVHDPDGNVTINCRGGAGEGRHFATVFGKTDLKPDITLSSSADASHELWLGRVDVVSALFTGKIKAAGDVGQAMKLVPAFKPIGAIYKDVLISLGRQDLVPK